MDEAEYLKDRLDDQIHWYSRKSNRAQRWFKRLREVEIVAAALIPLLATLAPRDARYNMVVAVLGIVVTVVAGMLGLHRYQERWIEYRSTSEALKHEKYLFLTRTEPYNVPQPLPMLVFRVEQLISSENSGWAQSLRSASTGAPQLAARGASAAPASMKAELGGASGTDEDLPPGSGRAAG